MYYRMYYVLDHILLQPHIIRENFSMKDSGEEEFTELTRCKGKILVHAGKIHMEEGEPQMILYCRYVARMEGWVR